MADHLREDYDYKCYRSFSSGAFGKVHSGYLLSTGESVVIKKGKRRDLMPEYEILKQLSDIGVGKIHVVRVIGYTDHSHAGYNIIMERAQCSLDQLLHQVPFQMGLPAVDIIQLVADLGIVFQFLLERSVTHRDVKPQNILVFTGSNDHTKSQFIFKLCDFGAARETPDDKDLHTIVGTKPFLHPDILLEYLQHSQHFRTNAPYTAEKCDLWSLGVTIFNASTGELPWPQVAGVIEVRHLHENRRGAISAAQRADGRGYDYFDSIRADAYPRWLRAALSSLIRSQFTAASYTTFFKQCAYIAGAGGAKEMPEGAKGGQKRLVLLPSLTPSVHAEVDEHLFPGAHIPLPALFSLPVQSRTTFLTADGVTVFGPGHPVSLASVPGDTVLVWNEAATGFGPDNAKARPIFDSSLEVNHLCRVQLCYDLDRECDDIIEAHRVATHIAKRNVDRVIARAKEHAQWLHSIERNEKHAASTATVAAVMQSRNKEMLDRLQPCSAETAKRKEEVERCTLAARRLAQCAAQWNPLDERHIPNWQDSLRRFSGRQEARSAAAFEMDIKWGETMLQRVQQRRDELKADCQQRVHEAEGGIAHVIRTVVALDAQLSECVRKMKETAALVSNVADQARDSVTSYMQTTAGLDEAQIIKNLMNSVSAVAMLRRNVEKQADLARQMEALRALLHDALAGRASVNGPNGPIKATVVQPTVINVNQSLASLDLNTITPASSSFT